MQHSWQPEVDLKALSATSQWMCNAEAGIGCSDGQECSMFDHYPGLCTSCLSQALPGRGSAWPHHRPKSNGTSPDSSSDADGEFIHMDDTGAMLLGLRGNEWALTCFVYSYLCRNWDLLYSYLITTGKSLQVGVTAPSEWWCHKSRISLPTPLCWMIPWKALKPLLRLVCAIKDGKRWSLASLVDDHRTVQGTSRHYSTFLVIYIWRHLHHKLCCYSIE